MYYIIETYMTSYDGEFHSHIIANFSKYDDATDFVFGVGAKFLGYDDVNDAPEDLFGGYDAGVFDLEWLNNSQGEDLYEEACKQWEYFHVEICDWVLENEK